MDETFRRRQVLGALGLLGAAPLLAQEAPPPAPSVGHAISMAAKPAAAATA